MYLLYNRVFLYYGISKYVATFWSFFHLKNKWQYCFTNLFFPEIKTFELHKFKNTIYSRYEKVLHIFWVTLKKNVMCKPKDIFYWRYNNGNFFPKFLLYIISIIDKDSKNILIILHDYCKNIPKYYKLYSIDSKYS